MTLDDHIAQADRGLNHSAPPGADWMRPPGARRAVVVQSRTYADNKRATLEHLFPGAAVITPNVSLTGVGPLDEIIMLWRAETQRDRRWVLEDLFNRLDVGGKTLWLT